MKKIFLLIVILILSLTFVKSYADCPPGWISHTIEITNYPGCNGNRILVNVCVWCSITSNEMKFQVNEVIFPQGMCSPFYWPAFMDYLSARITANYFEFCTGSWIPCNSGTRDLYIKKPLCFYESDETEGDFYYCNTSWCIEHWQVCSNGNTVVKTFINKWVEGTPYPGCLDTEWSDNLTPGTCFHATDCQ